MLHLQMNVEGNSGKTLYMNGARLIPIMINQYSLRCKIYMKTYWGVLSYITGNDTKTEGAHVVIRSPKIANQI